MNYNDTQVIILNGPPRSGKDTLANALINLHPGVLMQLRFSQTLKDGAHRLLGITCPTEEYNDVKDEHHEDFFGMKPRDFYIALSQEFMKPRFGQEVFGHLWVREYERLMQVYETVYMRDSTHEYVKPPVVVITDCGFIDELRPLAAYFGAKNLHLLKIYREGFDFKSDSRDYIHGSDLGITSNNLINPNGAISTYVKNALDILEVRGILAQL